MSLNFNYYYGVETEQFSFFRIPRLLIKDKRFSGLSSDAKIIYGLMLERMSLSMRNGWVDEENRAYIVYTIENMIEDLGCSKPTCIKVIKELDTKTGIGLIERKRRGLGKPDIIYVKNFATLEADGQPENEPETKQESAEDTDNSKEEKKTDFEKKEDFTSESKETEPSEVKKLYFKRGNNFTSESKENELQEVKKFDPSYINNNYINNSYINPIYQSENINEDMIDEMDGINTYIEIIKKNLSYEDYMEYDISGDKELYDELFQVICDVVCIKRNSVRIGGEDYPYALVKAKFLKLTSSHLEYVMTCMKNTTTKIANIKAYMVTALYNAPNTMGHYYQQEVQHDMYGCVC